MQFAVGFRLQGKTGHVVVDAEDALIAALKVKMQRPEALIAYVRQQNKRGDARHPMRRLSNENPSSVTCSIERPAGMSLSRSLLG